MIHRFTATRRFTGTRRIAAALLLAILLADHASAAQGGFILCIQGVRYWYNRWQGRWEPRGACGPNALPQTDPNCLPRLTGRTEYGLDGSIIIRLFFENCDGTRSSGGDDPPVVPLDESEMGDPEYFRDKMRSLGITDEDVIRDLYSKMMADKLAKSVLREALKAALGRDPTEEEVLGAMGRWHQDRVRLSASRTKDIVLDELARRFADADATTRARWRRGLDSWTQDNRDLSKALLEAIKLLDINYARNMAGLPPMTRDDYRAARARIRDVLARAQEVRHMTAASARRWLDANPGAEEILARYSPTLYDEIIAKVGSRVNIRTGPGNPQDDPIWHLTFGAVTNDELMQMAADEWNDPWNWVALAMGGVGGRLGGTVATEVRANRQAIRQAARLAGEYADEAIEWSARATRVARMAAERGGGSEAATKAAETAARRARDLAQGAQRAAAAASRTRSIEEAGAALETASRARRRAQALAETAGRGGR